MRQSTLRKFVKLSFILSVLILSSVHAEEESELATVPASNWKTYENREFGFEIKYPLDGQISEFQSEITNSFLSKFYMSNCNGRFSNEIQVFKNLNRLVNYDQLRDFIKRSYGFDKWPDQFPLPEAEITETEIGNIPAIKVDYVELGEDPLAVAPSTLFFTLDQEFIYRLGCCCNMIDCNQALFSFRFIPRSDPVTYVYPYDPGKIRLKILDVTVIKAKVGEEVEGKVVAQNIGPSYKTTPGVIGPSIGISIFDEKNNLLLWYTTMLYPVQKSGSKIPFYWVTNKNDLLGTDISPFLIPSPARYKLEVKLYQEENNQVFDSMTTFFDVNE